MTLTIGSRVAYTADMAYLIDDPAYDLSIGTVVADDHTEGFTAPDDGVVLVKWSRTYLNWCYTEDLAVAP